MHGSVTPAIVGVSQAYLAWPKITEMDPLLAQRDTTRTRLTRVKQAESEQIVDVGSGRDQARVPAVPGRGHGFAKLENRPPFYAAAGRFLDRYPGGQAED